MPSLVPSSWLVRSKAATQAVRRRIPNAQSIEDGVRSLGQSPFRRRQIIRVNLIVTRFDVNDHKLSLVCGLDMRPYALLIQGFTPGSNLLGGIMRVWHTNVPPSPESGSRMGMCAVLYMASRVVETGGSVLI